jgi:hypothetical protein
MMFRNLTLAALPLFSLTFVAACTSTEPDELAGEAEVEDSLDGKSDSVNGASSYFAIRADFRRCAYPMCGGHYLDRLNASATKCHDAANRAECYTPELDWSQSGLSQEQQDALVGKAASVGEGVHAVVRGRFAPKNLTTPIPTLGRFIVTEAWVAQGEGGSDGVFAKVFENGIRCIAAPCPSLTEKALNSSRTMNISDVDFAAGDFTQDAIDGLINDYVAPGGIIVAGDRYSYKVGGRWGKGRTATQAYRNLANVAPTTSGPTVNDGCFVGGCSGQICSDTEGLISTCQFLPEYACFRAPTATCEQQANGHCGWTQDADLQACLANPPPF